MQVKFAGETCLRPRLRDEGTRCFNLFTVTTKSFVPLESSSLNERAEASSVVSEVADDFGSFDSESDATAEEFTTSSLSSASSSSSSEDSDISYLGMSTFFRDVGACFVTGDLNVTEEVTFMLGTRAAGDVGVSGIILSLVTKLLGVC